MDRCHPLIPLRGDSPPILFLPSISGQSLHLVFQSLLFVGIGQFSDISQHNHLETCPRFSLSQKVKAPIGQLSTHEGFPSQRSHFLAMPSLASTLIIPQGHASTHRLQPVHLCWSTSHAPKEAFDIASSGQAFAHGAGTMSPMAPFRQQQALPKSCN